MRLEDVVGGARRGLVGDVSGEGRHRIRRSV